MMNETNFLSIFQEKLEKLGYSLIGEKNRNDDNTQYRVYSSTSCKYDFFIIKNNQFISASIYEKQCDKNGNWSAEQKVVFLVMFVFRDQTFLIDDYLKKDNKVIQGKEMHKIIDYYFDKVEEVTKKRKVLS